MLTQEDIDILAEETCRYSQPQEFIDRLLEQIEELEAEREQCRQRMLKMVE